MEFKQEVWANQSVSEVWQILGNDYANAHKWAAGLYHSEGMGQPQLEGASCNTRSCDTSSGKIKEEIRVFDPANYVLAYEVIDGFPFFVDTAVNRWSLHPQGDKTLIKMHLTMKTKGLVGFLMAPMMKLQINKVTRDAVADLKYYVEHGVPSPQKAREMAKRQKQVA